MGISHRFATLLERIQPLQSELDALEKRDLAIKRKLNTAFDLCDCKMTGSFARRTSISGFSDLDIFPVFRKTEFTRGGILVSSDTALKRIKDSLIDRYPTTIVARDQMAVAIHFADNTKVDVVPALFESMYERRWPVYQIPDGTGDWMRTCPSVYDKFILGANRRSGGKLRYVAQLIKFWRECRSPRIPISSFHIEMMLAQEDACKVANSYEECILNLLTILSNRQCRAIRDPFGIGGYIGAVKTASQREMAHGAVNHSLEHARAGIAADNVFDARRQWNIVFNKNFPS